MQYSTMIMPSKSIKSNIKSNINSKREKSASPGMLLQLSSEDELDDAQEKIKEIKQIYNIPENIELSEDDEVYHQPAAVSHYSMTRTRL